jgi:iron only hydrogenase large subunit-like protein
MNPFQPIFTEKTKCQDCYKCVRNCPVKAIKIENGVASVVEELCVYCGRCVNSCPAGAKKVRNDRPVVMLLLESKKKLVVSLAPSWVGEFPGVDMSQMVASIEMLGFQAVSETALGAQEISAHAAGLIAGNTPMPYVSSACPTVVEFVRKYYPAKTGFLTPLCSPLLAHCKMLKALFGEKTGIVFFGPCIAKKREAHDHPDLLEAALTFEDLRTLFDEKKINPAALPVTAAAFVPERACEGALYPVDGGMIACIKAGCAVHDKAAMHFSGMEEVTSALDALDAIVLERPLFLELLACSGGCVNGPKARPGKGTLAKRIAVIGSAHYDHHVVPRAPGIDVTEAFTRAAMTESVVTEAQIQEVMRQSGKHSALDERNCGGCGYTGCRDFAAAVVNKKAETAMCVTYMRQQALNKANKLIVTMPSAVVIVDTACAIIECNARFAKLAGEESEELYAEIGTLAGALLDKVIPVGHLFRHVLETGEEIREKDVVLEGRILKCSIFSIERDAIIGGIFNDVTEPQMKKEEVIKRAGEVISKNLETVQKIAYLLGENASQTEIVLNTIIDSYNEQRLKGHTR